MPNGLQVRRNAYGDEAFVLLEDATWFFYLSGLRPHAGTHIAYRQVDLLPLSADPFPRQNPVYYGLSEPCIIEPAYPTMQPAIEALRRLMDGIEQDGFDAFLMEHLL